MKFITALFAILFLALFATSLRAQQQHAVTASLVPVDDSGVTGKVHVQQLPQGGSNITVVAKGLNPGQDYFSLYYENHICELEQYSEDDVIGTYIGNPAGVGMAHGQLEDDLDEINSISVRTGDVEDIPNSTLLSCADIHPGP
jgi:hypothetical protein